MGGRFLSVSSVTSVLKTVAVAVCAADAREKPSRKP